MSLERSILKKILTDPMYVSIGDRDITIDGWAELTEDEIKFCLKLIDEPDNADNGVDTGHA